MAIFGIGAYYDSKKDMTDSFLSNGVACIGWERKDAVSLHTLMRYIKVGDVIYIKSHPPNKGLIIKAVGLVIDNGIQPKSGLGKACIGVKWIWSGYKVIGQMSDRYPVRNITLYEEMNPEIQRKVLDLLLSRVKSKT